MKIQWETKDVIPGRIVCKQPAGRSFKADGHSAKWSYKIGFMPGDISPPVRDENGKWKSNHFCTVAMTDGMVIGPKSAEEMVQWLNNNQMIPMPHKWLLEVVEYLRGVYEISED